MHPSHYLLETPILVSHFKQSSDPKTQNKTTKLLNVQKFLMTEQSLRISEVSSYLQTGHECSHKELMMVQHSKTQENH